MTSKYLTTGIFSFFFILISCTVYCQPQNKETLKKKAIADVAANPDDLKAHEAYIDAMDIKDPALAAQYETWMKVFPKSGIVPFAIGKAYEEHDQLGFEKYLLAAVKLKPGLAEAWALLSRKASLSGDSVMAVEYMQHATLSEPKNADYAYYSVSLHQNGDPAKYDSLMLNVAYRFPDSERGAQALNNVASLTYNQNEKIAYYDALFNLFSKQQSGWFISGMRDYYDYLLNTNPNQAFSLALKMVLVIKVNRQDWKQRFVIARDFIEAHKLLASGKPADALAILNRIDLKNKIMSAAINADESLALFKAEAMAANNKTRDAYDSLASFYSKAPSDKLHQSLIKYTLKLNIDSNKVDTDIWAIRNKAAWKETNFTLQSYVDNQPESLAHYRGKVVLLTYWFPSCGPCRLEFPHFEAVLKKLNNKNVAYLAINIFNQDQDAVMPLVKNSGYTFIPLRDAPDKLKGNLPEVRIAPANFLIDQHGRVVFSDFQIDGKNERTLELMISELLKMGS